MPNPRKCKLLNVKQPKEVISIKNISSHEEAMMEQLDCSPKRIGYGTTRRCDIKIRPRNRTAKKP